MERRERHTLIGLQGVQSFLDAHSATLPGINQTGARALLDEAVGRLSEVTMRQDPMRLQRGEELGRERGIRREIRLRWMHPMSKVARASEIVGNRPDLPKVRVPAFHIDAATFTILAHAIQQIGVDHADVFTSAGLPVGFTQDFADAIDALEAAVAVRQRSHAARVGATRVVKRELSVGVAAVRMLDAILAPMLAGNADLLGDWAFTKSGLSRQSLSASAPVAPTPVDERT